MARGRTVGNPEDLTPQGNKNSTKKPNALVLRARHLSEIMLVYAQSLSSQTPSRMGHVSVEIPQDGDRACKSHSAGRNGSTSAVFGVGSATYTSLLSMENRALLFNGTITIVSITEFLVG